MTRPKSSINGFVGVPALIAGLAFVVGSLVIGLTVSQVTNLHNTQDTRSQAFDSSGGSTCDAYGNCSPSPTSYSCDGTCISISHCSEEGMVAGTGTCKSGTICCKPAPTNSSSPTSSPKPSGASCFGDVPDGNFVCFSWTECVVCRNGLFSSTKADNTPVQRWDCPKNSYCYQTPPTPTPPTSTPTITTNTCVANGGQCVNSTWTCTPSGTIAGNCGANQKCVSEAAKCVAPTPPPTSTPTPTPTLTTSKKPNYASCSTNEECQSNNCQSAPGGKYCLPANNTVSTPVSAGGTCGTTAYNRECVAGYSCQNNICKPIPSPTPTPLSTEDQNLLKTYNVLNTITFGAFGAYVQSNIEQNAKYGVSSVDFSDPQYWDRVMNYENWRAATQLGATITGEIAVGVYAGAAITGGLSVGAALTGGAATANLLFSTANTAAVCTTPQDFLNNPNCQMATAQNLTATGGLVTGTLSAGSKVVPYGLKVASTAINATDTTLGGINTYNYCQQYGVDGTCLLFGATTALGTISTTLDYRQLSKEINTKLDSIKGLKSDPSNYDMAWLKQPQTTTLPNQNRIIESLNPDGVLDLTPQNGERVITIYKGLPDPNIANVCPTCKTMAGLNPAKVIEQRLDTGRDIMSFYEEYYYSHHSPFSSWTTDPNRAKFYAGETGKVVKIKVPTSLVIDVNGLGNPPFENDFEILVPGIIPQSVQTQIFP